MCSSDLIAEPFHIPRRVERLRRQQFPDPPCRGPNRGTSAAHRFNERPRQTFLEARLQLDIHGVQPVEDWISARERSQKIDPLRYAMGNSKPFPGG